MRTEKRIEELKKAVFTAADKNDDLIVADIATDHGYLPHALSLCENVSKIIATDISEKSLNKLTDRIKQFDLKKIKTLVGDGLNPIDELVDVAVIAGVGGFEIIKMLKNQNKSANGKNKCDKFVLQPAQNVVELREWIFDNKLFLISDYIIEDAGRFYPILIVDVGKIQNNKKDVFNLFIGRDNKLSSVDFILYLKDYLTFLEFLESLPKQRIDGDLVLKRKWELKNIIESLLKK